MHRGAEFVGLDRDVDGVFAEERPEPDQDGFWQRRGLYRSASQYGAASDQPSASATELAVGVGSPMRRCAIE
jgi:hypothetical protein